MKAETIVEYHQLSWPFERGLKFSESLRMGRYSDVAVPNISDIAIGMK